MRIDEENYDRALTDLELDRAALKRTQEKIVAQQWQLAELRKEETRWVNRINELEEWLEANEHFSLKKHEKRPVRRKKFFRNAQEHV